MKRILLGWLALLVASACGPKTTGGSDTITNPDGDTITTPDGDFTRLSLRSSGGMPWALSGDAECLDPTHVDVISVDGTSGVLTWDICSHAETVETGQRTLTAEEFASVKSALSNIVVSSTGQCLIDAPYETLDLDVGQSVKAYVDDVGSCGPAPDGRTYIKNVAGLDSVLWDLCHAQPTPITNPDGDFIRLTIHSSGGMPPSALSGDAECLNATHKDVISVDGATGLLTWDACNSAQTVETGQRTLTAEELASVKSALSNIVVGNSGQCGLDKPYETLDLDLGQSVKAYVDDFSSCKPALDVQAPDGRTYVKHIDGLFGALWNLCQPTSIAPKTCGGAAGVQCAANEFCTYANHGCGGSSSSGTCTLRPQACPDIYEPVCACDGTVYANECAANAAGVAVGDTGSCTAPAGTASCGAHFCSLATEYCKGIDADPYVAGPSGAGTIGCQPLPASCGTAPTCDCITDRTCEGFRMFSCHGAQSTGLRAWCTVY